MANTGLGLFYTTVELSVHPIFFINIVIFIFIVIYLLFNLYLLLCILLGDYF